MKTHKSIAKRKKLSYILFVITIIAIISPIAYWIKNPELTEMQMLLKFWYAYASAILCFVGGFILQTDDELIF